MWEVDEGENVEEEEDEWQDGYIDTERSAQVPEIQAVPKIWTNPEGRDMFTKKQNVNVNTIL